MYHQKTSAVEIILYSMIGFLLGSGLLIIIVQVITSELTSPNAGDRIQGNGSYRFEEWNDPEPSVEPDNQGH